MKKISICYSKTEKFKTIMHSPVSALSHYFYYSSYTSQLKNKLFMSRMAGKPPQSGLNTFPQCSDRVCMPGTSAHTLTTEISATRSFLPGTQLPAQPEPCTMCPLLLNVETQQWCFVPHWMSCLRPSWSSSKSRQEKCSAGRQQLLILAAGSTLPSRVAPYREHLGNSVWE